MAVNSPLYQGWKTIVLAEDRYAPDSLLYPLWTEQRTPDEAIAILTEHKCWRPKPKGYKGYAQRGRPAATLTMQDVQKRLAVAIGDECLRLALRKLEPNARAFIVEQKAASDRVAFAERMADLVEED